jgi:hypothetical protein
MSACSAGDNGGRAEAFRELMAKLMTNVVMDVKRQSRQMSSTSTDHEQVCLQVPAEHLAGMPEGISIDPSVCHGTPANQALSALKCDVALWWIAHRTK